MVCLAAPRVKLSWVMARSIWASATGRLSGGNIDRGRLQSCFSQYREADQPCQLTSAAGHIYLKSDLHCGRYITHRHCDRHPHSHPPLSTAPHRPNLRSWLFDTTFHLLVIFFLVCPHRYVCDFAEKRASPTHESHAQLRGDQWRIRRENQGRHYLQDAFSQREQAPDTANPVLFRVSSQVHSTNASAATHAHTYALHIASLVSKPYV